MTDNILADFLGPVDLDKGMLDSDGLRAIWVTLLGGRETDFGELETTVLRRCPVEWPDSAGIPPDELGLRVGSWQLDLTKLAARASLSAVITAAAIAVAFPDTPIDVVGVGFIVGIVGTVLEIERVEVSARGRLVLADLKLRPEVMERFFDVRALYEKLPAETRSQINLLDFADVVEQLRAAGEAEDGPVGMVRIRPRE